MAHDLAKWLSRLFHPFVLGPTTLLTLMYLTGTSLNESFKWVTITIVVTIVPLMGVMIYFLKKGSIDSLDISIREKRTFFYLIALLGFCVLTAILYFGNAPYIIFICLCTALVSSVISMFINRLFTKVSLHAGTMAGCATALLFVSVYIGVILLALLPLIGWARIRLKQHSIQQIVLGWGVGISSVMVIFTVFGVR